MVFENSRYLHSKMYTRLGWDSPVLQARERYQFTQEGMTLYEWVEGDTLDGVAYRQYGSTALRWAILDANPRYRTEFDIMPGDQISIPDFDEVAAIVNVG